MKKIALLFVAALIGSAQAAYTVKTIASGETFEIYGTKGDSPVYNNETCILDLQGGGTLKMNVKSESFKLLYLWSSLICTNGAATLELDASATEFNGKRNFIVRAPGSLTIKAPSGCKNIYWGHDGASSSDFAQYDFTGLTDIVDLSSGERLTPSYFQFTNPGTLLGLPPSFLPLTVKASTSMAMVSKLFSGATVALGPTSGFAANLYVLDEGVFTSGQTVTLASNRILYLRPSIVPDFATEQSLAWQTKQQEDITPYHFNVTGENNRTVIQGSASRSLEFAGKVTGQVQLQPSSSCSFSCSGDLTDWTGLADVGSGTTLCLNATNVVEAKLSANSTLRFDARISSATIDTLTGTAQSASLVALPNQKLTITAAGGFMTLSGDAGETTDEIDIVAAGPNGAKIADDGTATVTFNGAATPTSGISLPDDGTATKYWGLPNPDGVIASLGSWRTPPASNAWYVAYGDVTVDTLPRGYSIRHAAGDAGTTTLQASLSGDSVVGVASGDATVLKPKSYDWRTKALLWLDPSQEETFVWVREKDDETSAIQTGTSTMPGSASSETCNALRGLLDPRDTDQEGLRAWQSRSYQNYDTKGYECLAYVHPLRAMQGSPMEGLSYLSFNNYGASRRINFVTWTNGMTGATAYKKGTSTVAAKFAVFVFGSQGGGGSAIFGINNYLKRSGHTLSDPMMPVSIDVWTNGVKVADSSTALFSGSWDVFAMDLSGATSGISVLGGNGASNSDYGGHFLGETLFFDEVLSDADRRDVELYLAKKWGLASKYAGTRNVGHADVSGAGAVSVPADAQVSLSGAFTGTLSVGAGASVTLASGTTPFTEAEIAELNPSLWLDPSEPGTLTFCSGANWGMVDRLYQRGDTSHTQLYATGGGTARAPTTRTVPAYLGPSRTWVDYGGTNETVETMGNTMRLRQNGGATDLKVNTQTGFIVQDSMRGGGSPFLCDVYGHAPVLARYDKAASYPIYETGTTAALTNSPVYLNGTSVDYTKGFTGGPEVFTFTATEAIPVGFFASYYNSDKGKQYGEIESEILLFASSLDATTRSRIEAYLMAKWFGFAPAGFTDYSAATLDGAGAFTATSAAVAPKLASTFEGTYAVGGESAAYTVTVQANGTVTSALLAPSATLSLPAVVALNVVLDPSDAHLPKGDYVLVEAQTLGESAFTLTGPLAAREKFSLVQTDTQVILRVTPKGLYFLLR